MAYFNERRSVEAVILPLSFIPVISGGMSSKDAKERDHIILLLKCAMDECLPHMPQNDYQRIFKRAREAVFEGFLKKQENENQLAVKGGLALYYFINNMMEQDAYKIIEGSNFDKALTLILPMLGEWLKEVKLDQSSFKEAKRMLTRLNDLGYYRDVKWVTTFTPETKEA